MGEKKKPRVNMTMRLRVLTALFLVIGFGLVGVRLLYMQVFHHDFYIQKATSLQTRDTFITPNRGKIYDANMQVLAESAEVERITVSPKAVVSETKEKNGVTADVQRQTLATILSETLDVSYDSVMEKLNKTDSEYEIIAQKVDKDVTKELNAKLEAAGCTGVYSEPDTKRYYQHGSFLSAVLGYVGSDNNGAYGIESQYNDELSGTAGRIVRVQNAQNEDIVPDTQQYIPAKDGNSLVLTIDSDIQNYLEKHLETAFADNPEARDGVSGIVMNIKTGEVLAMANLPDFDPNDAYHLTSEVYINELKTDVQKILTDAKIAAVIPDKWYEEGGLANLPEELQKNDDIVSKLGSARVNILMKTWRNPVVSDNYEPGSTFKLMTVATAYELGEVNEDSSFYCGGSLMVGDWKEPINCANTSGHGMQTLTEALMNSCNVAMMQIVQKVGMARFYEFYKAFGLLDQTGIDLPGESRGQFHNTSETSDWNEVALATASFGQRFTVTPMQMITMVSAIVDDGKLKKPYVVKNVLNADGTIKSTTDPEVLRQVISEETSATMRQIIESVVTEGTAKNGSVVGYRIGGKTGTAEKTDQTDSNGQQTNDKIVSFVGIAPMDDPEYVVLIALDTPNPATGTYISGGVMAAPTVARVMEDILPYLGVEPDYSEVDMSRVTVRMPNLAGKTESEAAAILEEDHLNYKIIGDGDKIVSQIPAHGRELPGNSTVLLYTDDSMPADEVEVPNLTGMTVAQASTTLSQLGLYLQAKGTDSNAWYVLVTKQDIDAGTKVPRGTMIAVTFTDTTALD